jgi:hypothetical protein
MTEMNYMPACIGFRGFNNLLRRCYIYRYLSTVSCHICNLLQMPDIFQLIFHRWTAAYVVLMSECVCVDRCQGPPTYRCTIKLCQCTANGHLFHTHRCSGALTLTHDCTIFVDVIANMATRRRTAVTSAPTAARMSGHSTKCCS